MNAANFSQSTESSTPADQRAAPILETRSDPAGFARIKPFEEVIKRPRFRGEAQRSQRNQNPRDSQKIVRSQPDVGSFPEVRQLGDAQWIPLKLQSEESQQGSKRGQQLLAQPRIIVKCADGGAIEERRARIDGARLTQRKQPLNIIVRCLEPIEIPPADLLERAALIVGGLSEIKLYN